MIKLQFVLLVAIAILLSACSGSGYENKINQNFDNINDWYKEVPTLTNEQAHSGKISTFMDSTHEFSSTYEVNYEEIKKKGFTHVKVSAWGMVPDVNAKANLVISVNSPEGNRAYSAIAYSKYIFKINEWTEITNELELPEVKEKGAVLKVYGWVTNKQKSYMDDVTIEFN
ncbi:hypothetical protein BH11BAC2_BH11BAC2_10660 [soil metagenome]